LPVLGRDPGRLSVGLCQLAQGFDVFLGTNKGTAGGDGLDLVQQGRQVVVR